MCPKKSGHEILLNRESKHGTTKIHCTLRQHDAGLLLTWYTPIQMNRCKKLHAAL
jgi:hypothetical protein